MTWIPGSSPGMTKGGGIQHYLHIMTWIPGAGPGMTPAKVYVDKTLFFCRQPRRRPGAIAPQGHLYMHHDLDSGGRPRNDKGGSVCGKNSVFLPSPRRRPGAIAPQEHLYMHHDLDSGVKPRNDKGGSVFFILRTLFQVSFYEHCLCVCRGRFRMCHSGA